MLRIIYLGTPQFAVPTLLELIKADDFEVVAAVCQPDRPRGRGNKVEEPPVKKAALEHNIPVFQPISLAKSPDVVEAMAALKPDVLVMVAFGQILKQAVLTMAPYGVINVHGSLLPKLRGAAPINWSIINGDTITGVTTMQTEAGLDTGPMLLKDEIVIDDEMTAEGLAAKMSEVGAHLLVKTLRKLKDGLLVAEKQNDDEATFAPRLDKSMSPIDWSKGSRQIHDQVRGLAPWPATTTRFRGQELKIVRTKLIDLNAQAALSAKITGKPGTIYRHEQELLVECGGGGAGREGCEKSFLQILEVQALSRAKTEAKNWVNGVRLVDGERFE
ncbi:MAG: methionyl-tRNA formyltransferase [Cyanobacteria bacterium REEB67]|nr:methionyl-tRNA formyltransferase [Cyanobacteria bacterium REEB67]